jgi:xanthine/CO dehydrogenase XdhC/CoxF family maturation factor
VTVLIERLDDATAPYLRFIEECQAAGKPCVVATVIGVEGTYPAKIGDRLVCAADHTARAEPAADLLPELRADVDAALRAMQSRQVRYELPSGRLQVLIELVPPPVQLIIFGAGHDAEPLVAMAKELGWRVSLVARRLLQGTRTRFARADQIVQLSADSISSIAKSGLSARAAAIIMSHDYAADLAALSQVVASDVAYIGVLGPRHRTDTLISDIAAQGDEISHEDMMRIHAPVGLDIGAESPEQVALAMIAEVQAFYAKRAGGPLKDRDGPIHDAIEGHRPASTAIDASCGLDS